MNTKKTLTLSDFTFKVCAPANRNQCLSITIYEDGKFNLNGKLTQKLWGKFVCISFTENAQNVALLENDSNDSILKIPKSGSVKLPMAVDHLKRNKIPFPAKYEVNYDIAENFWRGDYCESPTTAPFKGRRNTK